MRLLTDLNIHHLRNISSARFTLHPQCNLFFGPNGSGKTSILEAIYLLCSGHSFRTREISPLISHGEPAMTVFARTGDDESISIQKSMSGPTKVKLNRQPCYSSSELAHFLPCQIFYQDIFQIIDAGPSTRRTLLDWGLFHVEHSYHLLWKNYKQVLKQRNALLRQRASKSSFVPWDTQLVNLAVELDRVRAAYFIRWAEKFNQILPLLTDVPCSIHYFKGWDRKDQKLGLEQIISDQFEQDMQRQYTHSGAHQADILFDISSQKAKLLLSRGQQKIILIALKIAQASLLQDGCLYLLDDVSAELDSNHLQRLMKCLSSRNGQLFLTGIDESQHRLFDGLCDLKSFALTQEVFS